ncbi:LOW QUALITY PROTEIN: BH3-like motif-containing cell death inducer [Ursus arctos]|uniref:LOW QUALITY PROTEIN: BH3-like motif-containing cell death inducer n=1 Tax=Ursus arctos TaxID=9644 RepID=UPI0025494341|nr:LOW QUALITY PROTEIN: BH3-like motif-containing cell death inducer [Ursus arctos]
MYSVNRTPDGLEGEETGEGEISRENAQVIQEEARKDLSVRSCKTESVLCTARIGQASESSLYPEAEWTLLPATRTLLSFNKRPKETVFPLTRYNLGSSTIRGAVLGNVLQKLLYLTRIQIALLHNSPC